MSDLIDRQQAIDALGEEPEVWEDDDEYGMGQRSEWCYIKKTIEKLPSAQPERKRGEWIPDNNCYYETRYICSECKLPFRVETFMMKPSWWFCPNCGADMRGESDE